MFLKLAALFCVLAVTTEAKNTRILRGTEAKPHEFPHMVSLHGAFQFCGGAILSENWVITAGHCPSLAPRRYAFRIKAGKHSLKIFENTEQVVNVSKIFVHENYTSDVSPNDIALLKLAQPLTFNEYVKPIDLPEINSEVDGRVDFSGWGTYTESGASPAILQKAHFNVIDFNACKKADEDTFGSPSSVTDSMLCVMSPSLIKGTYACPGDSGGPLIKRENHQIRLVGVFSWLVEPCGYEGAPSVFTKVSSYVDWIKKTMSNN